MCRAMTTRRRGVFAAEISWPELERRVQSGAVGILPVGAACKAHGPHLPMDSDYLQAAWLAGALMERADVLVWPCVSYGHYPAFTDYPGSISLALDTFQAMVREILGGIRRAGVRAVLLLNTGISTIQPLETAAAATRGDLRIRLANVYQGPRFLRAMGEVEEQPRGGHADEIETSLLLAIARERVALDRAQGWTPASMDEPGPFSRADPKSARYSPGGVWGDPTLASVEKGRCLLAAMVEDLLTALGELARTVNREQ